MKISKFIQRLQELQTVAEQDVEVTVASRPMSVGSGSCTGRRPVRPSYETAAAELQLVVPVGDDRWEDRDSQNTHEIVVVF